MDVQITVASKTPGAADKKTSKVTDTTGKTWHVYNNMWGQMQEGGSYLITKYKVNDFKGSTYYMVEAFTPAGAGGGGGRGSVPLTNGGTREAGPPMYSKSPDNAKVEIERRLDIFICCHWNNLISNPNVHPLEMTYEVKVRELEETRRAWLAVMGPNRPSPISTASERMETAPPVRERDDLNDSIPF